MLEDDDQRGRRCPMPRNIQGQVGQSSEQNYLVEDVHIEEYRTTCVLSLPTQTIL